MREQFHPNAKVRLSWFSGSGADFVDGSRRSYQGGARSMHVLSAPDVKVDGDRALATVNAHISIHDRVGDVDVVLASFCRIHERLIRDVCGWRILDLQVVYLWDALQARNPAERVTIDPGQLAAGRDSYACQAYLRWQAGAPVPPDLLGQDQPEEVARMMARNDAWLGTGTFECLAARQT